MAHTATHPRYTGKEVKLVVGAVTAAFAGITITVKKDKWTAKASDADVMQRGTKNFDAEIEIKGFDSNASGAGAFEAVAALVLSNQALTALTFTDDDTDTPASKLPTGFFTKFPLTGWGVDEAKGADWYENPAQWTIKLSPNNLDLAPAS